MAILSNLLVNGESRLLGKLYTNDVDIGNDLTVVNQVTAKRLYIDTDYNPSNLTTSNSDSAPFAVGKKTGRHIVIDADEVSAKSNATTSSSLYLNFGGGTVYLSNGTSIYASNGTFRAPTVIVATSLGNTSNYVPNAYITTATITTGNITTANTNKINNADMITTSAMDVKGKLHAVEYDLENIMDLGGSFVVAPTLIVPSSGSGTKTLTVAKSNDTTVVLTVKDPSITSTGIAGFAWANNYKVKVSGLINNTVLGTCDGYINSTNVSSNTISLTVTMDSATVTAIATTVSNYKLNIMLYNTDTSSATAVTKPLGIYLQHYQLTNNPIINVWNGQTTTPKVRIGYLGGITYNNENLGTNAQNSWGLYSDNVFLEGQIVAKGGKIAGWTIGDGYITTNSNRTTYDSTSYNGMTMTESGIGARGSATSYFNLSTGGGLTAVGATVTGVITANTGYIGGTSGWTIASQQLSSGTLASDNSMYLATKNLGNNTSIAGRSGSDWRLTVGSKFGVTNTGAIYSTGGKIGGWTIDTNKIYSGTHSTWNSTAEDGLYLGNDGIAGGSGGIWYLWKDGSAKIGAMTLSAAGVLEVPAANITGTLSADRIGAGSLSIGKINTTDQAAIKNETIYNNKFYQYSKNIVVYGDSNKYYPVYFKNDCALYDQNTPHKIFIYRGYAEQAPDDWNTSNHKGGLTLGVVWNYGGWGGATYNCEVTDWNEVYSTILGDIQVGIGSGITSAIFLRGGGTSGALYHILCDVKIDVTHYNGTFPAIGNNENVDTDYMYTGDYHWKYASPLTTPNTTHIESLMAKNTASSYITYINSTDGIKIHNAGDTTDYLQINSTAIKMYRNNTQKMYLDDSKLQFTNGSTVLAEYGSTVTIGETGTGKYNTYIDGNAVYMRKATTNLSKFDGNGVYFYDGSTITSQFTKNGAVIGKTSSNHVLLSGTQLQLKNNGTVLADFGSTITLGQTTGQAAVIDSSGMQIYNGGTQVAEFGENIKIGKGEESSMSILPDSLQISDANNANIFSVDMNGANRTLTLKESAICKASTNTIYNSKITQNASNGTAITASVYYGSSFGSSGRTVNWSVTKGTSYSNSSDTEINITYDGQNKFTFNFKKGYTDNTRVTIQCVSTGMTPVYTFGTRSDSTIGGFSTIIGEELIASGDNQIVVGRYNTSDSNKIFIIGNGQTDNTRKNILTVDRDGNLKCNNIGVTYSASDTDSIVSTNVDTYVEGATITLPAGGVYILHAYATFPSNSTETIRRLQLYNITAQSALRTDSKYGRYYVTASIMDTFYISGSVDQKYQARVSAGVAISNVATYIKAIRIA